MLSSRRRTRLLLLACALGAAVLPTVSARAAAPPDNTPLILGREDFSLAVDCFQLITYGNYTLNVGTNARMAQEGTREDPPKVGEPFYLRFFAQVITTNCGQTAILPEVLLPEGVRLAVDAAHPITWQYPLDYDSPPNADPAGVVVSPGQFGGMQIASPGPASWPLRNNGTGNPLLLRFPVVSSRAIAGQPDAATNQCNDAPCPPGNVATRDLVQVVSAISDGGSRAYLVPNVGLTVAGGPPSDGPPGARPPGGSPAGTPPPVRRLTLSLPRSLRSGALGRAIVVRVRGPIGARVSAKLSVGRRSVGRRSATVGRSGTTKVTFRLGAKARATVRRSRSPLVVRVSAVGKPGPRVTAASARILIRR